jgi:hypothetical protein
MSIGLKRIQVHLWGFSSSQIWNIAWQDWRLLGKIDTQYSVPKAATGNNEDYKQYWCCFYGSTTDWIPSENWLSCRGGPGQWLNGRLTKAILPVGMGGPNNLDKAAAEDELKQQMQIWAHVCARCTTCGRNTYMDLEGGNQRLSSHTENVESQSIGFFSECDMEDGAEDGNRGLMSNVAIIFLQFRRSRQLRKIKTPVQLLSTPLLIYMLLYQWYRISAWIHRPVTSTF